MISTKGGGVAFLWICVQVADGPTLTPTWSALTGLRSLFFIIIIIVILTIKDVIKSRDLGLVGPRQSCSEVMVWIRVKYIIYTCELFKELIKILFLKDVPEL